MRDGPSPPLCLKELYPVKPLAQLPPQQDVQFVHAF